jgi:IS605 OrfB family transposase
VAESARIRDWQDTWDESRNGRVSARGDRTKHGNPLRRVIAEGDRRCLEITCDTQQPGHVFGQNPRFDKLSIPLYIARKVSQKTGQRHGRDYEALLHQILASGDPYQVEILRRQGCYPVRITVEEPPAPVQTSARQGWVGVDTHSTFLALCHVLPDGNPKACATVGDPRLYDVRSTQRDALMGRLAIEVVQWAKTRGAGLAVEDVHFVQDRDVSAKFNRVTHQFNDRALLTAVERQPAREGVALQKVHPAYTSMIGRFKYQPQYGIRVHHAATLVIGRRGGLKVRRENIPKALRRWMQAGDQWHDLTYRTKDWSACLEYRQTLLSE